MRPDPLDAWEHLSSQLPGRLRVFELTVNYRTPAEIMAYVEQQREITGIRRHPPRSVRFSGNEPQVRTIDERDVVATVERLVAEHSSGPGTLAVIAPERVIGELRAALGHDVACLTARGAKGLEYDVIVLALPDMIADEDGGAALYVALTRATRELIVLRRSNGGPVDGSG
jgi:DNA helicase IV